MRKLKNSGWLRKTLAFLMVITMLFSSFVTVSAASPCEKRVLPDEYWQLRNYITNNTLDGDERVYEELDYGLEGDSYVFYFLSNEEGYIDISMVWKVTTDVYIIVYLDIFENCVDSLVGYSYEDERFSSPIYCDYSDRIYPDFKDIANISVDFQHSCSDGQTDYHMSDLYDAATIDSLTESGLELAIEVWETALENQTGGTITFDDLSVSTIMDHNCGTDDICDDCGGYDMPYVDVTNADANYSWFGKAIKSMYDDQIMNGMDAAHFAPYANITRADFALTLYRMAGKPVPTSGNRFTDVQAGAYYENAVIWASENGIVKGLGDGTFKPNANISRQDMVVMLYRYSGSPSNLATGDLSNFRDVAYVYDYAEDALKWAISQNLLKGNADGGLAPQKSITRAEIAVILDRYLG